MNRQNIQSVFGMNWTHDVTSLLLPYQGTHTDPALAARYEALGRLPDQSFGKTFWNLYKKNLYSFPGDEHALNEAFSTPHDAAHVLSGYDTTPHGEILVSTFTAGMHPNKPMAGHILPAIFRLAPWGGIQPGREVNDRSTGSRTILGSLGAWL